VHSRTENRAREPSGVPAASPIVSERLRSVRWLPVAGNKSAWINVLDFRDDFGRAVGAAPIINIAPRDYKSRDEVGVRVVAAPSLGPGKIAIGVRLAAGQVRAIAAHQHVSLGAAENGAVEHLLVRHPEAEYSLAVGTRDCGIGRKPSSVPFSRHSCTASCALACSAARNRIKAKPQALRSWR
jgi:hypothetical protein